MTSPWDPQWRPDPTGRRLAIIRASRRGAILAACLFGPVVWLATAVTSPLGIGDSIGGAAFGCLMSLPGLALLGAALTPAAIGSRASAAAAGLAMGIGVPVAAVASAMIAVWVVVAFVSGPDRAGQLAGSVLRDGVIAAETIAPVVAAAAIAWVVLIRRIAGVVDGVSDRPPDRPPDRRPH
jgi:hypothetical protein